jgi:hypothetical protein
MSIKLGLGQPLRDPFLEVSDQLWYARLKDNKGKRYKLSHPAPWITAVCCGFRYNMDALIEFLSFERPSTHYDREMKIEYYRNTEGKNPSNLARPEWCPICDIAVHCDSLGIISPRTEEQLLRDMKSKSKEDLAQLGEDVQMLWTLTQYQICGPQHPDAYIVFPMYKKEFKEAYAGYPELKGSYRNINFGPRLLLYLKESKSRVSWQSYELTEEKKFFTSPNSLLRVESLDEVVRKYCLQFFRQSRYFHQILLHRILQIMMGVMFRYWT